MSSPRDRHKGHSAFKPCELGGSGGSFIPWQRGEDFCLPGTPSPYAVVVPDRPSRTMGRGRTRVYLFARFARSGISPASGLREHASPTDQKPCGSFTGC